MTQRNVDSNLSERFGSVRKAAILMLGAGMTASAALQASAQPIAVHMKPFEERVLDVCEEPAEPVIQLAICLDTSGSMQGLINQARSRIWSVIRDLDRATYQGQKPRLEVALYQYGSSHHPSHEGFMTCVMPFTSDLDEMSEALYSLRMGGSAEYCGQAVERASRELSWRPTSDHVMKVLVIAGNETFAQGPVRYERSIPEAVEYGITVNTVHCGPDGGGRQGGWKHAADMGGGVYNVIDHNREFIEIHCPQDDRLRELNLKLNGTYLHYGQRGEEQRRRQIRADARLEQESPAAMQNRIAAKAGGQYHNSHWDLVDAATEEGFDVSEVDRSTLLPELREATDDELLAEIGSLTAEREAIRAEIATLSAEREAWLKTEYTRRGESEEDALDAALIAALRSQAKAQGFAFEK